MTKQVGRTWPASPTTTRSSGPRTCCRCTSMWTPPGARDWCRQAPLCGWMSGGSRTPSSMSGSPALLVQCGVFELPSSSGHRWVNVADMYKKLGLTLCPGNGPGWLQKKEKSWRKLGEELALGERAVRLSLPYRRACSAGDPRRCLPFASISLRLCLLQAVRAAHATEHRHGLVRSQDARGAFARLFRGLMSKCPTRRDIPVRLDAQAHFVGDGFVGKCAATIELRDGRVYFQRVMGVVQAGASSMSQGDLAWMSFCQLLCSHDGQDLSAFFISLSNLACSSANGLARSLFSQVLYHVGATVEKRLYRQAKIRDARALIRVPKAASAPDVAILAKPLAAVPIWSASNPRHTARELGRYLEAARADLHGVVNISLAGPESTKVGTDFSVTMGAFMNCKTGKVSMAVPQDPSSVCSRVWAYGPASGRRRTHMRHQWGAFQKP